MDITVTKSKLEDAGELAALLTQAMYYKLDRGDMAWSDVPYTAEELEGKIKEGDTYSAWLDNELVGTLIFKLDDEKIWGDQPPVAVYIHQLAVRDGYHGRGIGRQLLEWSSKQADEQGRRLLRIDVPPQNKGLKKYYEQLGFKWVMDREVQFPKSTYTAALYEREVK